MKKFLSVICAGVLAVGSFSFNHSTVTAETEQHDNVLFFQSRRKL